MQTSEYPLGILNDGTTKQSTIKTGRTILLLTPANKIQGNILFIEITMQAYAVWNVT